MQDVQVRVYVEKKWYIQFVHRLLVAYIVHYQSGVRGEGPREKAGEVPSPASPPPPIPVPIPIPASNYTRIRRHASKSQVLA